MKSPWKVVERCEWTVLALAATYLVIHIAIWIARFGK